MSVGFDSDEIVLKKLRERLRRMIREGSSQGLAENLFQRQLDEAKAEERSTDIIITALRQFAYNLL